MPLEDGRLKNLLQRPGPQLMQDISRALAVTARAFPIPKNHKEDLPFAVRDLSRLLTAAATCFCK